MTGKGETKRRLLLSKWRTDQEANADDIANLTEHAERLEAVVETVIYWMQDTLQLGKPMTDPRKILTMLERAI